MRYGIYILKCNFLIFNKFKGHLLFILDIYTSFGEGNGTPTPVLLPGESQGQGSLVGCRLWGRTESDTTEAT